MRLLVDNPPHQGWKPLSELLLEAFDTDHWPTHLVEMLRNGVRQYRKVILSDCIMDEGTLHY